MMHANRFDLTLRPCAFLICPHNIFRPYTITSYIPHFQFSQATFLRRTSSEEETAPLVDQKDIGQTASLISFLQQDHISQPNDAFDYEKASETTLFKLVGFLKEHVDFWMNPIRASDFIINTIVEGYTIPFFDLPESFVIPNRLSAFKLV